MKAIDVISDILRDNRFTPESLPELENKLFFEGDRQRPYLVRFTVLIFLSTLIATGGIIADSTATVIGAMIVAPLMTPIVATTAALVMGRLFLAVKSIRIVIWGIILVIFLSWFIGVINFSFFSFETNSQITARISPDLIDLWVAFAAGAAGAFALSRDDIADSLPGVAIAIALVPPLCVVGISLSHGQWDAVFGSSLLFLTNLLAILLTGGAVFALLNLGPASIKRHDLTRKGQIKAYIYIALGVLVEALPLAISSLRVGRETLLESKIISMTEDWLGESESDLKIDDVNVFNNKVEIVVRGTSEPQLTEKLGEELVSLIPGLGESKLRINISWEMPIPTGEEGS